MFVLIGRFLPFVTTEYVHVFVGGSGLYAIYGSLVKKGPVSNIRPSPIIASISCKGVKFTPKRAHPIDLVRKVFECNMMQG